MGKFVGRPIERKEDARFLRGAGRYLADVVSPESLHVAFVRSPVAAARVAGIETAAARQAPGVVRVVTGSEFAELCGVIPMVYRPDPVFNECFGVEFVEPEIRALAVDRVRYVGEPLCAVVTEDRYLAEDAAELVDVTYEPVEPVLDTAGAVTDSTPSVYDHCPDNVAMRVSYALGTLPDDDAPGVVVVEDSYEIGRHSGVPLEGRGARAIYDGERGRVDLWTTTGMPHILRDVICRAAGWPAEALRVVAPDVGGSFGPKVNIYGEDAVLAVLARELGREVSWVEDRYEHLVSCAQSRDQRHRARLYADATGRIVGWKVGFDVDIGAYNFWVGGVVANTAIHLLGPYRIPACHVTGRAVYTNKTPTVQYRGAGRPEACFALERSLDRLAEVLGISRQEVRERNLLTGSDLPYAPGIPQRDGVPIVYDGADYRATFRACVDAVADEAQALRQASTGDLRIGVGYANFVEATGRGPFENARIRLDGDGAFTLWVGSAAAGQGHETSLAQVAADVLQTTPEAVRLRAGDTGTLEQGIGSFASRTAVVAGSAVHLAAGALLARATDAVARAAGAGREDVTLTEDGFRSADQPAPRSWQEVAAWFAAGGRFDGEPALEDEATFRPETVTWTMGTHAAVVSVDTGSGAVRVLRYFVANEEGRIINPLIVQGQIRGGVAQGIGGTLFEEFAYDADGQPQSTTLAHYLLPLATDVPRVEVVHTEEGPTDRNPLGVKGVGEGGTIPVYAAVASAVDDALRDGGGRAHVRRTPIRARDVLRTILDAP